MDGVPKMEEALAKGEYTKLKRESWNAPKLTQARSPQRISPKRAQSCPGEITPVTLGHFRATRPGESNNTQTRIHLAQTQLG